LGWGIGMDDPKPEWHELETKMGGDAGATAAVRSPGSSSSSNSPPGTVGVSFFLTPLLAMGTVLANRYEILEVLGQGGMGAVYKVFDRELERFVALKTIRPDLAGNAEMLARFKQELVLARQVAHRNIVRLYDISDGSGVKFITMEYVEGEDFRSVLRREGKLSPDESINVIRQICFALQAAHSEGIIHRDLKPQNIMRDKLGRVVVMDFGLARALESEGMTQTGALLGTMEYMSPEQAKGEQVDRTSDIYAAGLIFYELLTGKMPFAAESALASLMKRSQQRAIPAAELDRGVPRNLSAIVSHCIEPDRKKRYQSATEILGDLEALNPTARTAISFVGPRRVQSTPIFKWIALAFLVLAIAVGGYLGWKKFGTTTVVHHAPVSVLVADFENHTGDPVFDGTLEPVFNVALERASFIDAFDRGEARVLAKQLSKVGSDRLDEEAARLVANRQGLGAVVWGSLSSRGSDGYKFSIELLDGATGKTIDSSDVLVAKKDDVLLAVPQLVATVRKALGDTTPQSVQLAAAETFTTSSLEAAHQYGVGEQQLSVGQMEDALKSFSKAVEIDKDFGRAYSGMAATSRNLGKWDDAEKYFKQAIEHINRMTERERYRTRGSYYIMLGNFPKCVEEYSTLASEFPADNAGHHQLAVCYSELRKLPKAVEEARRAVELYPNDALGRRNLALFLCYAGDFEACEREARAALKINPDYAKGYLTLAYAQLGQGQQSQTFETYRQLERTGKIGPAFGSSGLADLAIYQGRYSDAVRGLQQSLAGDLATKDLLAPEKFTALSYVQLLRGDKALALDAAQRALALSKKPNIRFMVSRILVAAGESARAQSLAAELAADSHLEPQADAKLIEGEIALQAGNPQQAIKLFTDANQILDTWLGRFDLGRAYLATGQFAEADSEFDRCIKRRGEALELNDGPTYGYVPAVYYFQGRVRQGLKSSGAADSYNTYLGIRGKAGEDPLLAEVRAHLNQ
jgi:eukaryotic-like serine/threonine-protein kinase